MAIPLITDNQAAITALCERYGVSKLDLFGSGATGAFDPATSDLDFVVAFVDYGPGVSSRFIDFADALEALFDRRVDLISEPTKRNPYFWTAVNESRESVYESQGSKALV